MPAASAAACRLVNATESRLPLCGFVPAPPDAYAVHKPDFAFPVASGPTGTRPGVSDFVGCVAAAALACSLGFGIDSPTWEAASLIADWAGAGSVLVAAAAVVAPSTVTA